MIKAALRPDAVNKLPIVVEQEDADRWLAEQIQTSFPLDGEVMNVSVAADTPLETSLLTASVAKAYIDEVVNQEKKSRSLRLSELQNTLRDKDAERERKNAELKDLAKTLWSKDSQTLSNQQRVAQEHWMTVYKEWISVQTQVGRLESELELKQGELSRAQAAEGDAGQTLVSTHELESAYVVDPILTDLQLQFESLQKEMESVRRTGSLSQVQKLEPQHARNLQEIQNRMASRRNEIQEARRRLKRAMLSEEVSQIASDLDIHRRWEERLHQDEARLRDSVKEFGGTSLVVEGLQREIESLDKLIEPMDRQARELEIELRRPNRVTRITRLKVEGETGVPVADKDLKLEEFAAAIRPDSPDPNSKIRKTTGAGIVFGGLMIAGVLYIEVRSKRVNSSIDVSQTLGLPVIGAIPLIPVTAVSASGTRAHRYRRSRMLLNESMRGVMAHLLHDAPLGDSQVIMVSSANSGEGKSTLATNLAVALARTGYHTLLVDCDLRRPSLGDLFDLTAAPGVSEILRQEVTLDQALSAVETANLTVLTAGQWSPNDVSLLANGATENLFANLRSQFQFVIVDGAPILGVAESQLLCRHADTVLFSILRDVSSGPRIAAACETLAHFGVRSLYAVVTGASKGDHSYYYSGYGLDE